MKIEKLNINLIANPSLIKRGDRGNMDHNKVSKGEKESNYTPKNKELIKNDSQATRYYKAFFAIDENKNVVIKVVDQEGNLVRQIPPEEYLKVVESMKMISKKLLHLEV
jgi:uncharacterized FlaG/YvyC family protein